MYVWQSPVQVSDGEAAMYYLSIMGKHSQWTFNLLFCSHTKKWIVQVVKLNYPPPSPDKFTLLKPVSQPLLKLLTEHFKSRFFRVREKYTDIIDR